jgi:cysteine desulfurase/selenocysteine lyase
MMSAVRSAEDLDVDAIRAQFPILQREIRPGVPLVYLDSAATSQKPQRVIDSLSNFLASHNANIHRGIHVLAEEATQAYEDARGKVARLVGAASASEIVFTRNATEAINLVVASWGRANLGPGDRVLLTEMEHHANLVPWYMLADEIGFALDFVPITDDGRLELEAYRRLLEKEPKVVAFSQMSNVLGTINPAQEMTHQAHGAGALVLIDAAQSVPHMPVDVRALDVDFLAFSGHKMCGPTGIGALYARRDLLEDMPPYMGGGEMIKRVGLGTFVPNDVPHKFEAGTPAIAEAVALGEAVDFLTEIGLDRVYAHDQAMISYALERLEEVPGVHVLGPEASQRGGVAAFTFEGLHPHDVAQILDSQGIAVRAGHHCAMPLHERYQIPATTRASFYLYSKPSEVDALIEGLYKVKEVFG